MHSGDRVVGSRRQGREDNRTGAQGSRLPPFLRIPAGTASESYPGNPAENVTYSYDSIAGGKVAKGRLTGIADTTGTAAMVYDRRGNVLSATRTIAGVPYVTAYAWDLADRLTKITYPSGRIVDYAQHAPRQGDFDALHLVVELGQIHVHDGPGPALPLTLLRVLLEWPGRRDRLFVVQ